MLLDDETGKSFNFSERLLEYLKTYYNKLQHIILQRRNKSFY